MKALVDGHRAVDAARDVRMMTAVRYAMHADADETRAWIDRKTERHRAPSAAGIAEARRQSLEAFGFRVIEPPQE